MKPTLVVGNKNYSSWSLRPWLGLRHAGVDFDEVRISLFVPGYRQQIARWSPAGKVPILHHGEVTVWDSLAILEYAAESWPGIPLWPADGAERAHARAISAEMHSGFPSLRSELPMNLRSAPRRVSMSEAAAADVARVQAIWSSCRERARTKRDGGGPWLFGRFSIADAMYAPVATRFATYGVGGDRVVAEYRDTVLTDPHFREWQDAARAETEVIGDDEVGEPAEPEPKSASGAESSR